MTPRLRHFPAPNAAFWISERGVVIFCPCVSNDVCVCFNHHTAPFLCKHNIHPHAPRPETPVAYEVVMATAEMHSGLLTCSWDPCCAAASGGNAGKAKRRGSGVERMANWGLIVSDQLSWLSTRTHRWDLFWSWHSGVSLLLELSLLKLHDEETRMRWKKSGWEKKGKYEERLIKAKTKWNS